MKCFLPFPLFSSPQAGRARLTDFVTSSFAVCCMPLENFAFFLATPIGKNFLCSVLQRLQNLSCGVQPTGDTKNTSSPSLHMSSIAAKMEDSEGGM